MAGRRPGHAVESWSDGQIQAAAARGPRRRHGVPREVPDVRRGRARADAAARPARARARAAADADVPRGLVRALLPGPAARLRRRGQRRAALAGGRAAPVPARRADEALARPARRRGAVRPAVTDTPA